MEGKKEEISFEIQSFKVEKATHGVSRGSSLTPVSLLSHYCQSYLQRGLPGLLLALSRLLTDFGGIWGGNLLTVFFTHMEIEVKKKTR